MSGSYVSGVMPRGRFRCASECGVTPNLDLAPTPTIGYVQRQIATSPDRYMRNPILIWLDCENHKGSFGNHEAKDVLLVLIKQRFHL